MMPQEAKDVEVEAVQATTGSPNIFEVFKHHFAEVIAAAKSEFADSAADLEQVKRAFDLRIEAARRYCEEQNPSWDGSADISKDRKDPRNIKYLLMLRKLGKEVYQPAMEAMQNIIGQNDKFCIKMLYRHIGESFKGGKRPAIIGSYVHRGKAVSYSFEPIRTEAHSSHSRNAYKVAEKGEEETEALTRTYTGPANALLVTSRDEKGPAPTAQFYRQAAKMAYEMYKKPKLHDKMVVAGVKTEIDFVRGIAADAFAGKLGALPVGAGESKEKPLIICENYLQLVSPIQGVIRGLVGALDAGKYSQEQMIDTQFVMKLLDGQKMQVDVPGHGNKWVKFDLSMMTLGINEGGIYTTARQDTLNASGLMRLHDQVMKAAKDNTIGGDTGDSLKGIGTALFDGDANVGQWTAKIAGIQQEIDKVRAKCFDEHGNLIPENVTKHYAQLQGLFAELDEAHLAKQKAYEAFRETGTYKNAISRFKNLVSDDIGAVIANNPQAKALCNAIKMQLDFEQLYLSGDWRDEAHYKEPHGLYINISHQLNQANAAAVTVANHGCSSAMDRAEMATRQGAALAQVVADSRGEYTQMYDWSSEHQAFRYNHNHNMQARAGAISEAIAQSGVSQANHVANSSTTGGKSENTRSGLDEMNSLSVGLVKFDTKDAFKSRGKRFLAGFVALLKLTFTNPVTRIAAYALGGVFAVLGTIFTLRPNWDLFKLVHAGIVTQHEKFMNQLKQAWGNGLPKEGKASAEQVTEAVEKACEMDVQAEVAAEANHGLADMAAGLGPVHVHPNAHLVLQAPEPSTIGPDLSDADTPRSGMQQDGPREEAGSPSADSSRENEPEQQRPTFS